MFTVYNVGMDGSSKFSKKSVMDYESLQFITAGGFQKTDDAHPAGTGKPGYRVVYKTLKMIPLPSAELKWPNLRVQFKFGKTSRGGIAVNGALDSRRPNMVIMPEYIDRTQKDGETNFTGRINMKFEFKAWEEELDSSGLVEMLLFTDSSSPQDILNEGRLHLSKMKMILELSGGNRLLGLPITEEVVELFPDWHWNRSMSSLLVGTESELNLERLDTEEFLKRIKPAVENTQTMMPDERKRIAIASSWYWKAESEADPINRLIEYWIAVEALEMPNTTNIRPIRDRLEAITGVASDEWKSCVGRLCNLRSELVHGKIREVSKNELELLRCMLLVLVHSHLFPGEKHEITERLLRLSGVRGT